jgi:hypothetical protein
MTNLLSLPQIPAGTTIDIANNVDFVDQFFVSVPGFNSTPQAIVGTLTANSETITNVSTTAGIAPGMSIVGYGIPEDTTIISISANSIVMSQFASVSYVSITLTILPPPLDLTGISFSSMIRQSATSNTVLLQATTGNGLMNNGGVDGEFGWSVPAAKLPMWPAALGATGSLSCVIDIQATDGTGAIVNLCALNGPIPLTINLTTTR